MDVSTESLPKGIAILAMLEVLVGIYYLVIGFGDLFVSATIRSLLYFGIPSNALAIIPRVLSIVLIIIGSVSMLVAWGLWTGKPWARLVALVFVILSIIASLVADHLVGIVIDATIVYYLTRSGVRQFFTKA